MSTNLHIDYSGNLILRDGKLDLYVSSQYVTPPHYGGGRVGALCLYAVEQVNHYYACGPRSNKEGLIILRELRACLARSAGEQVDSLGEGGIIGNLNSNEGLQEFKFGDKKLDRTYGLDLYDFEARQYDAIAPWFTSIDPLAEKFTWLTPYNYCAGDPVNCVDLDGRDMENAIEGDNYLLSRKTQQIVKYSSSDSQIGERKDVQNNNNYNFL